jgi:putative methionine-R-sulfoxide reductase with GAF domain
MKIFHLNPKMTIANKQKIPFLGWLLVFLTISDVFIRAVMTTQGVIWQNVIIFGSIAVSSGLLLSFMVCLWFGDKSKAAFFMLLEIAIRSSVTALLIEDSGFPFQFLLISLSTIIVLEWIPYKFFNQIMLIILVYSLVLLASDFIPITWQIKSTLPPYSRFGIAIFYITILFGYIAKKIPALPLRLKLTFLLLCISSVTVSGVAVVTNLAVQKSVQTEARVSLQATAESLAVSIDRIIESNLISIQTLAGASVLIDYLEIPPEQRSNSELTTQVINLLYSFVLRDTTSIISYTLLDHRGVVIADSSAAETGENLSYRSYFVAPISTGNAYVSPIYSPQSLDKPALNFSAPIRNNSNQIIGVLNVRYKPDIFQSIVVQANELAGVLSFGVILDENNIIIGHGVEPDLFGTPIAALVGGSNNDLSIEFFSIRKNPESSIAFFTRTTQIPWKVVFFQPKSVFDAPIKTLSNLAILFAEFVGVFVIILGNIGAKSLSAPIVSLTQTAKELIRGNLTASSPISSKDEIGQLAETFNLISSQLASFIDSMEKRVRDRTRSIEIASHVGQIITTILDPEILVREVVNELQKSFGYYHVHIYLLDKLKNSLVMVGGSGDVGETLLRINHQIPLGRGLVGRSALHVQTILSADTKLDPYWMPNPFLPDTASEIAVPILLGEELLGVLDVQQNQIGTLTKQDADLLELISSQVAIALRNAQHYREALNDAEMQSQLNIISELIRNTTTAETAIVVALDEISRLTGTKDIILQLKMAKSEFKV